MLMGAERGHANELSAGAMWTLAVRSSARLHGKRKVLKLGSNHTHVAEAERILLVKSRSTKIQ